jgi:glycosyltransferase involved in cell wall biosynthesis
VTVHPQRLAHALDWRMRAWRHSAANMRELLGWQRAAGPPLHGRFEPRTPPARDALPVVMCVWRRGDRLRRTIELLEAQTHAPVELYLWNNNSALVPLVEREARAAGIRVAATHSARNVGGFGRFFYARELAASHPYVVFFDDDQEFDNRLVETFAAEAAPRTISAYWAFRFVDADEYAARVGLAPGEQADYCGTNGMICDTSVFRDVRLFTCPRRYWFVEDLWLSYFASGVLGWELRKSAAELTEVDDSLNQFTRLGDTKTRLLRYLTRNGWIVGDPAARRRTAPGEPASRARTS